MLLSIMPLSLVFAAETTSIIITANKTIAYPDDVIDYEISIGSVKHLMGAEFKVIIPSGLTYVTGSALVVNDLEETLGCASADWTESSMKFTMYGDGDYSNNSNTLVLKFSCKINSNASGSVVPQITEIVLSDTNFEEISTHTNNTGGIVSINNRPISVTGVTLNKHNISLSTGDSETLIAVVCPDTASNKDVLWKSSDITVATVDSNGKVTAINKGSATITVTTADSSFTDTCSVSVACSHTNTTVHPAKASTCVTHGNNEYITCDDCGIVISGSDAKLPLAEHTYYETVETQYLKSAATCVSKPVYYKSCSVCGEKGTDTFEYGEVDLTNHIGDTYIVGQKVATCSAEGYTGDIYCSSCDKIIEYGNVTSKTAHTPSDKWDQIKAPTCTESGTEVEKCSVCGTIIDERTIPATGHTFGEWKQTKTPTCTEPGEETRVCACGETETREVLAKGHTLSEWEVTLKPTCTNHGEKKAICLDCGIEFVKEIPATGHQFGEWAVVKEATETEEGIKEHVCNVCGETETQIIPILTTESNNEETTIASTDSTTSNRFSDTSKKSPNTGSGTELIIASAVSSALIIVVLLVSSKKKKV